jgi:hypothetical protein
MMLSVKEIATIDFSRGRQATSPTCHGMNGVTNGVLVATSERANLNKVTVVGRGTITNFQNGIVFQGTNGAGAVDVAIVSD